MSPPKVSSPPPQKVIKRMKPKRKWLKLGYLIESLKLTWIQFSMRTTIQGVRYISDPKGTFFTKCMWLGITLVSLAFACTLSSTFWLRYKSNPTRMNVETNHGPMAQVAFPAITFCSSNLISPKKVADFVRTLILPENITRAEVIDALQESTGFSQKTEYETANLDLLQRIFINNRFTPETAMEKVKISCRELLYRCRWHGRTRDCMQMFQKSITYDGYCCSFNQAPFNKPEFSVIRSKNFGYKQGLSVIMKPNIDATALTKIYSEGVTMIVHESNTYPSDTSVAKLIPVRSESLVSIQTTITLCSNQVRALPITDRECVFIEEYSLKYFSGYREQNCDVECRMIKTMEVCECLPYYYPNFNDFPICNFTKIECLVDNYYLLRESVKNATTSNVCNCPASCNGYFYDVHLASAPLVVSNFSVDTFYKNLNASHAVVHIFMQSQVYRRMRRDLLTNLIVLASNFGGVFSLFLGVSVIGFLEVIYFMFVRVYKNYCLIRDRGPQKFKKEAMDKSDVVLMGRYNQTSYSDKYKLHHRVKEVSMGHM